MKKWYLYRKGMFRQFQTNANTLLTLGTLTGVMPDQSVSLKSCNKASKGEQSRTEQNRADVWVGLPQNASVKPHSTATQVTS